MTNPDLTHIAFVVDRSGSMQFIKDDMNGGIKSLLAEQINQPGDLTVSVVTFDTSIEEPYVFIPAQDVIDGPDIIVPRGGTALLDAIGVTVTRTGEVLAHRDEDDRPGKVIIVVVTDGMENSSQEWKIDAIKALVEKQQNDYGWEFVFLGANMDAVQVGGSFGFRKGSTITYAANAGGTDSVLRSAGGYISKSRAGAAASFSDDDRNAAKSE